MEASLTTRDLTRSFRGVVAVDGLTLDVAPGEVMALLGPNGAGKTTTVRLLNGILAPERGECRVLGLNPAVEGDAVRRRTGVLTEAAALDDRLTALENVVVHARIRGIDPADAERRTMNLLDRFDMANRAHEQVRGFSTGQRKRVALARALLHEPEVLFLDEPTSGLDPESTRDVLDLIASLAREQGRTVILCTHFLAEAGRLCERMAVLRKGALIALGRPAELASSLWHGVRVDLDLGREAGPDALAVMRASRGVSAAEAAPLGAQVTVDDRDAVPVLVASLVERGCDVFGVSALPPTMEDVYFALTQEPS
jgi:ABC-2 type transport system ATP-binding protein